MLSLLEQGNVHHDTSLDAFQDLLLHQPNPNEWKDEVGTLRQNVHHVSDHIVLYRQCILDTGSFCST